LRISRTSADVVGWLNLMRLAAVGIDWSRIAE
jgi:hypothetical protein